MVLGYHAPDRSYTWEELDALTERGDGATWPLAAALHFRSLGFSVAWIDAFDLARFGREGLSYLREFYGPEVAAQALHGDLEREQRRAARLANAIEPALRVPSRQDLETGLERGHPLICNVNAVALSGADGYLGHFIVLTGIDARGVRLHDPGLPPRPDRRVAW